MTPVVLVVEEQPALRTTYARFLRDEGYRVVAAAPSAEALRLLHDSAPDLVVLDPDGGGGQGRRIAAEALRLDPSVCLVFNTSDPRHLEMDFSSWLADAYVVRSTRISEIGDAVRRLLPLERPEKSVAVPRVRRRRESARA